MMTAAMMGAIPMPCTAGPIVEARASRAAAIVAVPSAGSPLSAAVVEDGPCGSWPRRGWWWAC